MVKPFFLYAVEARRAVAAAATAKLPTTNFQLDGSKEASTSTFLFPNEKDVDEILLRLLRLIVITNSVRNTSDSDVLRDLKMRGIDFIY